MKIDVKKFLKKSIRLNGVKYKLFLITKDFIFYGNLKESDENSSLIMLKKDLELVSNNYFAYIGFVEELKANVFEYISKDTVYNYNEMMKSGQFED